MPDTDVQHMSLPSQEPNNALKIVSPIMSDEEEDVERNLLVVNENTTGDEENDPEEQRKTASLSSSRDAEDDGGEEIDPSLVVNHQKQPTGDKKYHDSKLLKNNPVQMTSNFSPTDVEKKENKSRSKLFEEFLEKNSRMELLQPDYEERDVEQELMHARRLALEKAQNDLLSGFGLGFPMLSSLHYLPARHPFLPAAAAAAAAAAALQPKVSSAADLLTLTSLVHQQRMANGLMGHEDIHGSSIDDGRHSSSTAQSPEPEDLSLRPGGGLMFQQRQMSLEGAAIGLADSPALNIAGSSSSQQQQQQQQNWSFEEQFKQLYELGPDPKRKEFLDDLFSFMQKRGTPVTRIPIMAKQVLDLFELYKLVVSHGGLVEVINKKMWREITKGLNLPSSITSAAFTLRTQYMKYLYPYECEREKLSSPGELQSAIDGNRREGRRSGSSSFHHPHPHNHNHPAGGSGGNGHQLSFGQLSPSVLLAQAALGGPPATPTGRLMAMGSAGGAGTPNGNPLLSDEDGMLAAAMTPQQAFVAAYREQALALEAAQRHFELSQRENQRRALVGTSDGASSCSNDSLGADDLAPPQPVVISTTPSQLINGGRFGAELFGASSIGPVKRSASPALAPKDLAAKKSCVGDNNNGSGRSTPPPDAARKSGTQNTSGGVNSGAETSLLTSLPTTHIKVTSRGDGGQAKADSSLVVSMEINGIMYQGVLFAQPPRLSHAIQS